MRRRSRSPRWWSRAPTSSLKSPEHELTSCPSVGAAALSVASSTGLRFASMLAIATSSTSTHAHARSKTRVGVFEQRRAARVRARAAASRETRWGNCGEVRRSAAGLSQYLAPEPLLRSPAHVLSMSKEGLATPTYAYSLNNPLRCADPTGLAPSASTIYARILVLVAGGKFQQAIELWEAEFGSVAPAWLSNLQRAFDLANQRAGPCYSVAKNIFDGFRQLGQRPEYFYIRAKIGEFLSWYPDPSKPQSITIFDNGEHAAVLMGGRVYDAFTGPAGMTLVDYWSHLPNGRPLP